MYRIISNKYKSEGINVSYYTYHRTTNRASEENMQECTSSLKGIVMEKPWDTCMTFLSCKHNLHWQIQAWICKGVQYILFLKYISTDTPLTYVFILGENVKNAMFLLCFIRRVTPQLGNPSLLRNQRNWGRLLNRDNRIVNEQIHIARWKLSFWFQCHSNDCDFNWPCNQSMPIRSISNLFPIWAQTNEEFYWLATSDNKIVFSARNREVTAPYTNTELSCSRRTKTVAVCGA